MTGHELIMELKGTKCACGARKGSMKTFCYSCFTALPRAHQTALYNRIGEGYKEAYAQAVQYLSLNASQWRHRSESN